MIILTGWAETIIVQTPTIPDNSDRMGRKNNSANTYYSVLVHMSRTLLDTIQYLLKYMEGQVLLKYMEGQVCGENLNMMGYMMGYTRDKAGYGTIVSQVNHCPFNATDAEHGLKKRVVAPTT